MNGVWNQVQSSLRARLGTQDYEIWIMPIRAEAIGEHAIQLQVPNRYYQQWVQLNYGATLCQELSGAHGHPVTVSYKIVRGENTETEVLPKVAPRVTPASLSSIAPTQLPPRVESKPTPVVETPSPAERKIRTVKQGLNPDKNFENFVVGGCNQFAQACAQAVSHTLADPQYNPLFIYGDTGLGKTHLLQAIGSAVLQENPDTEILYVSAEQFTNDYIETIRSRTFPAFHEKYRKRPGVFLMDDVQFLSEKEGTQEELFHTFEELMKRGRQIVFTADVLPREIRGFQDRLRTRCESGMIAAMTAPDPETLIAILYQKAEDMGLVIPSDLAQYIASRMRGSVRELEGILHQLKARCDFFGTQPNLEFARQHLSGVLSQPKALTGDEIIGTVAAFFNIKVSDLKGTRRLKRFVRPRHIAMWMVREHTQHSFPEIGRLFGRDHATVQHACKKIRASMDSDADLKSTIQALSRNLSC